MSDIPPFALGSKLKVDVDFSALASSLCIFSITSLLAIISLSKVSKLIGVVKLPLLEQVLIRYVPKGYSSEATFEIPCDVVEFPEVIRKIAKHYKMREVK